MPRGVALAGSGEIDVWMHATSVPLDAAAADAAGGRLVAAEPDCESAGVLNRGGHYSFVLGGDAREKELYVFGGEADGVGREVLGDACGARVSSAGVVWEGLMPAEKRAPSARAWGASATLAGGRWPVGLLHGGRTALGALPDELWVFDPRAESANDVWAKAEANGESPGGRMYHQMVGVGEAALSVVVAGGWDGARHRNDVFVLDTSGFFPGASAGLQAAAAAADASAADDAAAAAAAAAPADEKGGKGDKKGKKKGGAAEDEAAAAAPAVEEKKPSKAAAAAPAVKAGPMMWTRLQLGGPGQPSPVPALTLHCACGYLKPPGANVAPGAPVYSSEWSLYVFGGLAQGQSAAAECTVFRLSVQCDVHSKAERTLVQNVRWSEAKFAEVGVKGIVPKGFYGASAAVATLDDTRGILVCGGVVGGGDDAAGAASPGATKPPPAALKAATTPGVLWLHLAGAERFGAAKWRALEAERLEALEAEKARPLPGWGRIEAPNGDTYEGQLAEGVKHGQGRMSYARGDVYEGEWQQGREHGAGVCRFASGDVYEGQWERGGRHGDGRQTYPAAEAAGDDAAVAAALAAGVLVIEGKPMHEYVGTWAEGKEHGTGIMVYASGDRYVGAWAAGLRDGRGTLEAADGTTYMGEWKAGRRCGHGVLQAADGAVYEGEFFDDAQHGHGVCTERDGATYDGEWHGGRRNGQGKCVYANRDVYEGKWKGGGRCGNGVCVYAAGHRYEGEWADDCRHGAGRHVATTGDVYEGMWAHDRRHGRGRCQYKSGAEYDGDWALGLKCGHGTGRVYNGFRFAYAYKGEWKDDKPNGVGEALLADESRFEGEWADGERHGEGECWHKDGSHYIGAYERDARSGHGVWTGARADGEARYEGKWASGERHGVGAATYATGDVFEGMWVGDAKRLGKLAYANGDEYEGDFGRNGRHGLGTCAYADGTVYHGEWVDDRQHVVSSNWVGLEGLDERTQKYMAHRAAGKAKEVEPAAAGKPARGGRGTRKVVPGS